MQTGREINYKDRLYNREMAQAGLDSADRMRAGAAVMKNFGNLIPDGLVDGSGFSGRTDGSGAKSGSASEAGLAVPVLYSRFDGPDAQASYTAESGQVFTFAGSAQLDTAQKKFGLSSLLLAEATGDYVSLPDSDDWAFGGGDFTVDFWVRFSSLGGSNSSLVGQATDSNNLWWCWWWGSGLQIAFIEGSVYKVSIYTTQTLATGVWYHIAFVRNGSNGYIFVNGVAQPVTSSPAFGTQTFANQTGTLRIGRLMAGGGWFSMNGWIDEVRITKGYARWTKDFAYALPTAQYDHSKGSLMSDVFKAPTDIEMAGVALKIQDTDTKLLLHGDAASPLFGDETGKVVSVVGNVTIDTSIARFGSSSMSFPGVAGSYLSLADSDDWYFGTGDFTIDFWVRFRDLANIQQVIGQWQDSNNYWQIYKYPSGGGHKWLIAFGSGGVGKGESAQTAVWSPIANQWYHIAFSKSKNVCHMFIDGVEQAMTINTAWGSDVGNLTGLLLIGGWSSSLPLNGWLDEVKVTKGVARFLTGFDQVDTPYGVNQLSAYIAKDADPYRILSLQFEGADASTTIVDDCSHTVTAVGTAQLDTAQKKWGVSSLLLDGNSDYLTVPNSYDWAFGTADWTVDTWIRFNAVPTTPGGQVLFEYRQDGTNESGIEIGWLSSPGTHYISIFCVSSSTEILDPRPYVYYTFVANTWYHIAVERTGTTFLFFVNGISQAIVSTPTVYTGSMPYYATGVLYVGSMGGITYFIDGWLDNFVIRKGIAKWTSNFTPPDNLNHFVKMPLIQEDNGQNIFQGGAVFRSQEMVDLGVRSDTQKRDLAYRLDFKNGSTMKVKGISTHWR